MSRVLVVDDERNILTSLQKWLSREGYQVATVRSGQEALAALEAERPDVVLMDIRMAGLSGLETLRHAKRVAPKIPIILMTAYGTTDTAIEAMKHGAFEYILKPFELPALHDLLRRAVAASRLMRTPVTFGETAPHADGEPILGRSPKMIDVYKTIGQVAGSPITVLIRGESGSGKELVARAIYQHSPRADKPFLAVNCAAIPESLLESELFGYEKGAFTGAASRKPGKFEQVQHGTIFLDEIGDMSALTQSKVLRVLQEQVCERLGGREPIPLDVRVLAATNQPLEAMVEQGRFREDLYYRLNVVTITLPPLRERAEDIPMLAGHFVSRCGREFGKPSMQMSGEALARCAAYDWPGNVRELENCIKQAVVLSPGDVILPEHLRLEALRPASAGNPADDSQMLADIRRLTRHYLQMAPGTAYQQVLELVEAQVIAEAMAQTRGNLAQAARQLGMARPTLRDKLSKYHIERANSPPSTDAS